MGNDRTFKYVQRKDVLTSLDKLNDQEIAALRPQERHALEYAEKLTAEIRAETPEQRAARQAPAQAFIDNCHRLADRAQGARLHMHTRLAILAKQRREMVLKAKELVDAAREEP